MKYRVQWAPVAQERLGDIAVHVARTDPVEALRLIDRITERGESLAENPNRGSHFRGEAESGLRQVIEGPFRLVYRVDEGEGAVDIVAVQHMAQGATEVEIDAGR